MSDIGLNAYLSGDCGGIGGRLKTFPEDFIVEEVPLEIPEDENGRYTLAFVRSRNWETNRLVRQLSRALGISRKRIYFAGTKDKRAITTQVMVFDASPEDVLSIRIKDVSITGVHRVKEPVFLGDLIGNRFEIIIRDVSEDAMETADCVSSVIKENGGFPNYFGVQRFGSVRPITHTVGKHIVRRDFRAAVLEYLGSPTPVEGEEAYEARKSFVETHDFEEALRNYPTYLTFERAILNHLVVNRDDWVGAIEQLPQNLSRMFVHAYQSYLFNLILTERIKRGIISELLVGDVVVGLENGMPVSREMFTVKERNLSRIRKRVEDGKAAITGAVFGHGTQLAEGVQGEIERSIIEKEGLKAEDFVFDRPDNLSSAGVRRPLLSKVMEMNIEPMGELSLKVSFMLPKGCYATSLLREFMKVEELTAYG